MAVTRDMLLGELKELQRLTAFEQAVATVRRAQAASTPIAQELAGNAAKAGERLGLLGQAVRGVGGSPDVVGPVLGKLGALVQTQVNQVQTLQGALLGDLALEHQLRERARYARTLAVTLGESSVIPVLDRLDTAHTETIGWLERRLAEIGRTGSSALKATPVQAAVGQVRKVAGVPFSYAAVGVNQVGALVLRLAGRVPAALDTVEQTASTAAGAAVDAAGQAADRAADALEDAADAVAGAVTSAAGTVESAAEQAVDTAQSAVGTAESVAEQAVDTAADVVIDVTDQATSAVSSAAQSVSDTVTDTVSDTVTSASDALSVTADQAADAVGVAADTAASAVDSAADTVAVAAQEAAEVTHEVLEATGGDDVSDAKPPFAGYERLTGDTIMRHVDDTEDVDELRTLLAFEQAHKARKGVLKTVQNRLTELAASV